MNTEITPIPVDSAIVADWIESFIDSIFDDSNSQAELEDITQASMSESKVYQIHRFNGQNYQLWRRQMEIYMTENKLRKYILGVEKRTEANGIQWDEKDAEAQAFIMRGIELEQLKYLTECTTAAEMWSKLKAVHAEKSEQSAQVLLEKFMCIKMSDDEAVVDFIANVTSIAQRLKDLELEQKPQMITAKILSSLPVKFDHVRTAWYAVPRESQTIERLTEHLVNEESLMNLRATERKEDITNAVYSLSKAKTYNNNNSSGKRRGNCNYCHKPGHWARECRKRQNKQQNTQDKRNQPQTLLLETKTNEGEWQTNKTADRENTYLFNLNVSENLNKVDGVFYADSGATDHMSFQRELFTNFKANISDIYVKVGDGRRLKVEGKGDIEVRGNSNVLHIIKDALLVPDLNKNFISISRATERGARVIFESGGQQVIFMNCGKTIAEGKSENGLYCMNLVPHVASSVNILTSDSAMLWHERLGHVNFTTLREMCEGNVANDLNITNFQEQQPFCEGCAYGKQHRKSFPKSGARRAKIPGEVFHMDLCGKMSVSSIGGSNYFLLLKDDHSRYCFVYFLKSKTCVLDKLRQFLVDVKADGHTIKRIRSDGGLEFCNEQVNQLLLQNNIKHEVTTPRAPEQNGFIERQNRTVVESAKAMIHNRQLPLYLWADAVHTAVYLKNRTASNVIKGCTPYQLWFGRKPSLGHLRIFGCEAFIHIPKEQRSKWERNSFKGILVGYHEESKAYRVFDANGRRVLIRRDVLFNEIPTTVNEVCEKQSDEYKAAEEDSTRSPSPPKSAKSSECKTLPAITRSPYKTRSTVRGQIQEENAMVPELNMVCIDPVSLEEAMSSKDCDKWREAITSEIESLMANKTWILVPRQEGMHVITNRWIFKKKYRANGDIEKYKARLVVRGCCQKQGIDYDEVFAPVVRHESVRMVLAIAAASGMYMIQFDVKTAFLHGHLEEEIYMEQPNGFIKDDRVCLLKRSLYGLKQASRQWNKCIVEFLTNFGFKQSRIDSCVFTYEMDNNIIYLLLYVDDGLICGNNTEMIEKLLHNLQVEFEITHREAEFFVGLQIQMDRHRGTLKLFQKVYAEKILERFNHMHCHPVSTPAEVGKYFSKDDATAINSRMPYREAIGSLMYLMVCTRPDIAYIVGVLSRYLEKPSETHWQGVKRILKYLKGTVDHGIHFNLCSKHLQLTTYSDADWGGDPDTRRSISGWAVFLNGGSIAWSSRKQTVTATSTTEAEFVSLCAASKAAKCFRQLINECGHEQQSPTTLYSDNQRAIHLVKNPESTKRTKHIDIQYFYTCEMQQKGEIDVQYLETREQLADIFTKPLSKEKFLYFVQNFVRP